MQAAVYISKQYCKVAVASTSSSMCTCKTNARKYARNRAVNQVVALLNNRNCQQQLETVHQSVYVEITSVLVREIATMCVGKYASLVI